MVFAKTDIGKAREQNQDYYYITPDDESPKIYILADGMGGYRGSPESRRGSKEAD